MPRRPALVLLLLAVLLLGCGGTGIPQRQPEAVDDGVQATGRLAGSRVAISDGNPETNLRDCDPQTPDEDVCWIARTIDGLTVVFVIENPAALTVGEDLPVGARDCATCDDVTDVAVVELRVDGEQRRASGGRLSVREAGDRYAMDFDVRFPDGDALTGSFNIRELLPGER